MAEGAAVTRARFMLFEVEADDKELPRVVGEVLDELIKRFGPGIVERVNVQYPSLSVSREERPGPAEPEGVPEAFAPPLGARAR